MVNFEKKKITPEFSRSLLEKNSNNRPVKISVVKRYSQDMAAGRWKEDTGECIKISESGNIIDGQHRLIAISESGKTLNLHIATGIKDSVFDVIDTGSVRSSADVFSIDKAKYASTIPAIIQNYHMLRAGFSISSKKDKLLATQTLLKEYNKKREYWEDVADKSLKWYVGFSRIIPPSVIGGLFAVLEEKSGTASTKPTDFMNQLMYGRELSNDTLFWLRKKLTDDRLSKTNKIPLSVKIGLLVKAWNLFKEGKQVKSLKLTTEIEGIL